MTIGLRASGNDHHRRHLAGVARSERQAQAGTVVRLNPFRSAGGAPGNSAFGGWAACAGALLSGPLP